MLKAVHILCAVRSREIVSRLSREMDDGEHCLFEIVDGGIQALKRCRACMPDILVIDEILPGIDGMGVVDELHRRPGGCMPRVIGGAATFLAQEGFRRRGADAVVHVPWRERELREALAEQLDALEERTDWEALEDSVRLAQTLLLEMGMRSGLKGFLYLSWAAALAYEREGRLDAVSNRIYAPVACYFSTNAANVERLIRHAIESTMTAAQVRGVYSLFGNTIDPAKGKPTNAQVIALLVQHMRIEKSKAI